jgi:glycosyltransferase involved in cell wall biosynthesis
MRISVVLPAFNEEKLLPRTLEGVEASRLAFARRGWQSEVIVCDNNSTDRTAAIARERGAQVVFEPVNQISRARNTGAAAATGDWILFLDADSVPTVGLFEEAADIVSRGDVMYLGACVQLDADIGLVGGFLLRGWNVLSRVCRWMAGSFVMVEASAFREVGGFSTEFFAGEEVDLSRRLKTLARRRGKRVAILRRHALTSSARRMTMYSRGEILRFVLRAAWRPWAVPQDRKACGMWYDGRR